MWCITGSILMGINHTLSEKNRFSINENEVVPLSDHFNISDYTQSNIIGELIDERIQLRYLDRFLNDTQCDWLVNFGETRYSESKLVLRNGTKITHPDRTSATAYSYKNETSMIWSIEQAAIEVLRINYNQLEALQLVRYLSGQEIKPHYDYFTGDYRKKLNNQRQYTIFVYLNNVENGGGTHFPRLNRTIQPRKGAALWWHNCANITQPYTDSLHAGLPPIGTNSVKYGLNIFSMYQPVVH